MKQELEATVYKIAQIIEQNDTKNQVTSSIMQTFKNSLYRILYNRYKRDWFPEKPFKASGFRCIRINKRQLDNNIAQAAEEAFKSPKGSRIIHDILDFELTMWVDPYECTYRIESMSIKTYYVSL